MDAQNLGALRLIIPRRREHFPDVVVFYFPKRQKLLPGR